MPAETAAHAVWTAEAKVPVSVTVDGVGPFTAVRDGDHGTVRIKNADGTDAKVTIATAAVVGYQGAVTERANVVFASNAAGLALVAEILADANA